MSADFYKNKPRGPGYSQAVRDWLRDLRHQDGREDREKRFRDFMRGNLATGGRLGMAPGVPLIPDPEADGHLPEEKP